MRALNKILVSTIFATVATTTTSVALADFGSLMKHVPAETPYLFANKKPMPDEVMKFHLDRAAQMMKLFKDMPKVDKGDKSLDGFINALMKDYIGKLAAGKFEETGLSKKTGIAIYGVDMFPVMRMTFSDKEKILGMIKNAEEKSGFKTELAKCGKLDCYTANEFAFIFLDDQVVLSAFPAANKEKMIKHLMGEADPKESYSLKKWDGFLDKNNYPGYGDGFVDLKGIYTTVKPLIAASLMGQLGEKDSEGCNAVIAAHVDNMPEITLGTKSMQTKEMDYELVLRTSSDVSDVLQGIANKANITKRSENAIFDLGVNINFLKLRDAVTQYSNFLIKTGEANKCSAIKAQDIRKSVGGMAMAMNMGLTQIKSAYVSMSNIKLDDKMQPKEVDALIAIGSDDPASLIGMVGMMSPALMGFQVPADGSVVKLPEGAIPSKGQPIPQIYLNRSDKSLNIMIGNDKPALKDYSSDVSQMQIFSINGNRYLEIVGDVLKKIPSMQKDEGLKMLGGMKGLSGTVLQEMSADKRGLVLSYRVLYD